VREITSDKRESVSLARMYESHAECLKLDRSARDGYRETDRQNDGHRA